MVFSNNRSISSVFLWHFLIFTVVGNKENFLKKFFKTSSKPSCAVLQVVRGLSRGFGILPNKQNLSVKQQARTGRFTEKGTLFLCLLRLSRIIDKNSYHDFFGITTFDHKAGKLKEFLKKVGIIFCNRHQFLVFETDNISLKVGITIPYTDFFGKH